MFFLKACPKCHGDLVCEGTDSDRWGEPPDILCIQCGYTARPPERDALLRRMRVAMRRREGVPVAQQPRQTVRGSV